MMDTAIVMQAPQYSNFLNQGNLLGLMGNASPTRQPTANVFATKDSFVQIVALRQPQVEKLFAALEASHLLELKAFASPQARLDNYIEVGQALTDLIKLETTSHWMIKLSAVGIPTAEIRGLAEVIEDPQFEYREVFETLPHPIDDTKAFTVVKAGYLLDADGPMVRTTPPILSQDTTSVLTSLGYNESQIASLRQQGIC